MSSPARLPVSIIVPAQDCAGRLQACLAAVAADLRDGDEVLVADAGSRDGTEVLARRLARADAACRRVPSPRQEGLAGAVRAGLRAATRAAVLVVDVRVDVPAGLLDLAHSALVGQPAAGALAVPMAGAAPILFGYRAPLAAIAEEVPGALLEPRLERLAQAMSAAGLRLLVAGGEEGTGRDAPPFAGAGARPPAPRRRLTIAIFTFDDPANACYQLRLGRPLEWAGPEAVVRHGMRCQGREWSVDPQVVEGADLVVVQRVFPAAWLRNVTDWLLSSGLPIVYETDDLLHDVPEANPHRGELQALAPAILEFAGRATAVTVSTEMLRAELLRWNPRVHVVPNLIDRRLWGASPPPWERGPGPVRIGYAGTATHLADLAIVEEALAAISRKWGDRVAFRFLGCVTERLKGLPGTAFVPFEPGYAAYARALPTAALDVAVAPLVENRFNTCKSDIKWLEYSACGAAGIYSDLQPYAGVEHGVTGLRVPNTTEAWFQALDQLVASDELRRRIGRQARETALSRRAMASGAPHLLDVYREIAGTARS